LDDDVYECMKRLYIYIDIYIYICDFLWPTQECVILCGIVCEYVSIWCICV
jgi:hypothetical protein